MLERWRWIQSKLDRWQQRHRKPLIITEIGYPCLETAAVNPWDYILKDDSKVVPEEQARCYISFFNSWEESRVELAGVFFYDWWGYGGESDPGYTPRDKPAEKVLQEWYLRRDFSPRRFPENDFKEITKE